MAKDGEFRKWPGMFIPAPIWLEKRLPIVEKAILVEVDSLSCYGNERICRKSNKAFAELLGMSESTVTRRISKLVKAKLLVEDRVQSEGNTRYLLVDYEALSKFLGGKYNEGSLCSFTTGSCQSGVTVLSNCPEGSSQNDETPINKKEQYRGNRTGKGNAPSPESSSGPEGKAVSAFIAARQQLVLLPETFFEWFTDEVLGRFDKYAVSKAVLRDWYHLLWKKYGPEIATKAVTEHRLKKKGWQPAWSEVVKIAQTLSSEQKKQQRQESERLADPPKDRAKTPHEMDSEELEEYIKKLEGEKRNAADNGRSVEFYESLIKRYRKMINEKESTTSVPVRSAGSG